ncbi:MAG: hypothetical protein AAF715_21430 [Myxococcota bacterium]
MVLLWGTAVSASGCGDEGLEQVVRQLGGGCLLDSDCEDPLVCVFRRCHFECETDRDCRDRGLQTACVLGDRPTNVCLLDDQVACVRHSDCLPGMFCDQAGVCRDACETDSECLADKICTTNGLCAPEDERGDVEPATPQAAGEKCLYNSQCGAPLVCLNALCSEQCSADVDCPGSATCVGDEVRACQSDEVGAACTYDENCASPLTCVGGQCQQTCTEDEDCPSMNCDDGAGVCVPGLSVDAECTYTSECMPPLQCINGACREECLQNSDCPSGFTCVDLPGPGNTTAGTCVPPANQGNPGHCADGTVSGDETGLDCGGSCTACAAGEACLQSGDCSSKVCDGGSMTCAAATCTDGVKNGLESGPDCGGPTCAPCATGVSCNVPTDCAGVDTCDAGVCVAPSCTDSVLNGDETSVDCGGSCAPCATTGATCIAPSDCASLVCTNGQCAAPSCNDGIANGTETAADCGGSCPLLCGVNAPCTVAQAADCVSGVCGANNLCAAPSCTDGVQNGNELGLDCGNGCPTGCPAGTFGCDADVDCDTTTGVRCFQGTSCRQTFDLTVNVAGPGTGIIDDATGGITACPGNCTTQVFDATNVTVTATPTGASSFVGWTAGCGGSTNQSCPLFVTGDLTLEATFGATSPTALWQSNAVATSRATAVGTAGTFLVGGRVSASGQNVTGCGNDATSGVDGWLARYSTAGTTPASTCVEHFTTGGSFNQEVRWVGVDNTTGAIFTAWSTGDSTQVSIYGTSSAPCAPTSIALARHDNGLANPPTWVRCHPDPGGFVTIFDGALTANNEIVLVGRYRNVVSLGGASSSANDGDDGSFVVVYDGNAGGDFVARGLTTAPGFSEYRGVAVDPTSGHIVTIGSCVEGQQFTTSLDSTGLTAANVGGASAGSADACIVRYGPALSSVEWIYQAGSPGGDHGLDVALLSTGAVVASGFFTNTVNFGVGPTISAQATDIFMLELSAAGVPVARASYGTTGDEYFNALAVGANDTIYVAGVKAGAIRPLDLGSGPASGASFVARFPAVGTPADWQRAVGTVSGPGWAEERAERRLVLTPSQQILLSAVGLNDDWGLGVVGANQAYAVLLPPVP